MQSICKSSQKFSIPLQNKTFSFSKPKTKVVVFFITLLLYSFQFVANFFLNIPAAVYLIVTTVLLTLLYFFLRKRMRNVVALLSCIIIVAPLGAFNMWGTYGFISFFMVFSGLFILDLLFAKKSRQKKRVGNYYANLFIFAILAFLASFVPLLLSNSLRIGIGSFLQYAFMFAMIIAAILSTDRLNQNDIKIIKTIFVIMSLAISVVMLVQSLSWHLFSFNIGVHILGGGRTAFILWFLDFSSNSLLFMIGPIILFTKHRRTVKDFIIMVVCLASLALSSARSSLFAAVIIFGIYTAFTIFTGKKQALVNVLFLATAAIGIALILFISRGDFSQFFDDTGRMDLMRGSLFYARDTWAFGTGFDWTPILASYGVIVHLYFLQVLNVGGLFFLVPLMLVYSMVIIIAIKKGHSQFFWLIIYVFTVSLFIPALIPNYIVVILFILPILSQSPKLSVSASKFSIPKKRGLVDNET